MLGILETTTILFAYEKIHQLENIRKKYLYLRLNITLYGLHWEKECKMINKIIKIIFDYN